MNKVSVIVPVYNSEKTIGVSIDSLLSQTYKNIEIIVINDGSSDKSEDIILSKMSQDNRILYLSKKNGGAASARNIGLKNITGEFVTFLDSDDEFLESTIEKLLNKIGNYDAVYPDIFLEKSKNNIKTKKLFDNGRINYNSYDFLKDVVLKQGSAWRVSSVLYRSDIIFKNDLKFDENNIAEDVKFNVKFLNHSCKITTLREETITVFRHNNSITASYKPRYNELIFELNNLFSTVLKEKDSYLLNSLFIKNFVLYIFDEVSKNTVQNLKMKRIKLIKDYDKIRFLPHHKKDIKNTFIFNSYYKQAYFNLVFYLIKREKIKFAINISWLLNKVFGFINKRG